MSFTPDEIEAIRKRLLDEHGAESLRLTPQQRQALLEIIEAYRVWRGMGKIGKALIWLLTALAGAVIAWEQITMRLWR